jgi:hypothetical protein
MKRLVSLLIFAIFFIAGCGDNSSGIALGDGASGPTTIATTGQIEGFMYQVNPVFLVDKAENAPPDSNPVDKGWVLARNEKEEMVGLALTDKEGRFFLDEVPGGLVKLEAWTDPTAAEPDTEVAVTAIPGALIKPGAEFPVTRDQAIEKVRPLFSPEDLVSCTLNPLPPSTSIQFDTEPDADRVSKSHQWMIFINHEPKAFFSHPATIVFLDANTGEVSQSQVQTYPVVNGAPMWGHPATLVNFEGPLPEAVQVPPELFTNEALTQSQRFRPQTTATENDVFVLLINSSDDSVGRGSLLTFNELVLDGVVPQSNITFLNYSNAFDTNASFKKRIAIELDKLNKKIDMRAGQGRETTLIVFLATHANFADLKKNGARVGPTYDYRGGDLVKAGLFDSKACRVRVILEHCFTEVIANDIETQAINDSVDKDIKIFAAASAREKCRYSIIDPDNGLQKAASIGIFSLRVAQNARIEGGELVGLEAFGPNGQPILDKNNKPTLVPGVGVQPKQTPVFISIPPKNPCSIDGTGDDSPIESESQTSRLTIRNNTEDRVVLKLMAENIVINEDKAIELEALESFEQTADGPMEGVDVVDFTPNDSTFPELSMNLDVLGGDTLTLDWNTAGDGRTMVTNPGRVEEDDPIAAAPPSDCSRIIYRNLSGDPVTLRFVSQDQLINDGNPITLEPGDTFIQSFPFPLTCLNVINIFQGDELDNGFCISVNCGTQQVFELTNLGETFFQEPLE